MGKRIEQILKYGLTMMLVAGLLFTGVISNSGRIQPCGASERELIELY